MLGCILRVSTPYLSYKRTQSIAHYIELFKSVFHKECTSKVFGLTFGGTSTFNTLFFRDDFKPINAEKDCFCHE